MDQFSDTGDTYLSTVTMEDITKYEVTIQIDDSWVCFRSRQYPPQLISPNEKRFGQAYYIASGIDCAKAEISNWNECNLYKVRPQTVHAFDLPSYAADHGCEDAFLKAKQDRDGYALCQSLANQLTQAGCSGVLYNSFKLYQQGIHGLCLALRPNSGELVGDTYFMKV